MDKTEFIQLEEFESHEEESPDAILEQALLDIREEKESKEKSNTQASDLMDDLDI